MPTQPGSLRTYLITRVLLAVPMLLILLTVVFLLMRVAPGDPISAALGGRVSQAELQRRRHEAGFDRPLIVQYVDYLGDAARFNFGTTLVDNRPLTQVIVQNGAATLELSVAAMIVAVVSGVGIGLLAGRFRDTPVDVAGRLFGIMMYGAPVFFLGFLAQLVFGKWLGWLPTTGRASPLVTYELHTRTNLFVVDAIIARNWSALWDVVRHLVLPATVWARGTGGGLIGLVRGSVLGALRGNWVEEAGAGGVREHRVFWKHAFKTGFVPVITGLGLRFAVLLSGAVLTEETFNWPGI